MKIDEFNLIIYFSLGHDDQRPGYIDQLKQLYTIYSVNYSIQEKLFAFSQLRKKNAIRFTNLGLNLFIS